MLSMKNPNLMNHHRQTRRSALKKTMLAAGSAAMLPLAGCEKPRTQSEPGRAQPRAARGDEEYVWLSANANLPLFTAHDHPALRLIGDELGVKVTIAGPNTVDIPSLVAAVEQTIVRRPAGIMVVGWDPSGLVGPINKAIASG